MARIVSALPVFMAASMASRPMGVPMGDGLPALAGGFGCVAVGLGALTGSPRYPRSARGTSAPSTLNALRYSPMVGGRLSAGCAE